MSRPLCDERYPAEAGACELSRWSGEVDRCRWCDRPARSGGCWCGHVCEDQYRRNHWWDHARQAAVTRDGCRCVRCGSGPELVTVAKLVLRALVPMGPVEAAEQWRTATWQSFRRACELEVHHLTPRLGAGYAAGCHHHLAGLETLCHRCHVASTADQQSARAASGVADGWAEAG